MYIHTCVEIHMSCTCTFKYNNILYLATFSAQGNSASQQLTEVDGSKIENSTGGGAANGNNTNAHSDDHK